MRGARLPARPDLPSSQQIDGKIAAPLPDTGSQVFQGICHRRDSPEEAAEVVMACKDDHLDATAGDAAGLFYQARVALAHPQVDLRAVSRKLPDRRK
ncbi:hypothetical protein [Kamptonema formosum]|uniref:hypothetical protein n=1 Tax=Kamptonema formosum TaxID=331992 RepID=UPI00034C0094